MQVVRNYGTNDAYNYGLLAGKLAGQMYENRERRGAWKDAQNMYARETANNLDTRNNAYKAALDARNNKINSTVGELQGLADAYNANQNSDTWNNMVSGIKRYSPNADINDPNAMTNLLSQAKSGNLPVYQQVNDNLRAEALKMNPNVDFSQADWANTTYQRGLDQANYYRNYENSNDGKTVNGEGNNKFVDYSTYRANDPYSATAPNPAAERRNNVIVLNSGIPLSETVFDALTRYYQGGR